jgi:hypothetical protein
MFTSIDKALVAVVMAGLFLLTEFTGVDLGLSQETVAAIIAAATPLLVYIVPNKRAAA